MAQRGKKGLDPGREVEARMGQYLAAFGSGAGDAHVSRAAVDFLRDRYLPCIRRKVEEEPRAWEAEGARVLALMRGVGRLAAARALARGDITVAPGDTEPACALVESSEQSGGGKTGNCP